MTYPLRKLEEIKAELEGMLDRLGTPKDADEVADFVGLFLLSHQDQSIFTEDELIELLQSMREIGKTDDADEWKS